MARRQEPGCRILTRRTHELSPSLAAAALQDHICKTVSFQDPVAEWRRKRRVQTLNVSSCNRGKDSQSFSEHRADVRGNRQPVSHSSGVTLQQQAPPPIQRHHDTRLSRAASRPRISANELEVVLDAKLPPLTLAQRLGLVEAPLPALSEAQWASVKSSSLARGDSRQPCPICQADYGLKEQVLLSCSHVFHKVCLQSFERYSGKKHCPMCRRPNYQTRLIHEGARQCREKAASRIQGVWRGHKVRMWYREHRRHVPPRDPSLRRRYFEQRLTSLTDQLVGTCSSGTSGVEGLLTRVEQNMAASRDVARLLDLRMQQREVDWVTMTTKAREKAATTDCAVCLAPLQTPPTSAHQMPRPLASSHQVPRPLACAHQVPRPLAHAHQVPRPLAMLSCGHVFHTMCMQALEHFTQDHSLHLCPICRTPYERVQLEV